MDGNVSPSLINFLASFIFAGTIDGGAIGTIYRMVKSFLLLTILEKVLESILYVETPSVTLTILLGFAPDNDINESSSVIGITISSPALLTHKIQFIP